MSEPDAEPAVDADGAPTCLEDLIVHLTATDTAPVRVQRVAPGRFIAFLTPGRLPTGASSAPGNGRLRLVSGDPSHQAAVALRSIAAAVAADAPGSDADGEPAQVMLVGRGHAGAIAVEVAHRNPHDAFDVAQVITTDAPGTQLAALRDDVPVLSLEDRSNPVALLGSLINAHADHLLTVVYDASSAPGVPADLPAVVAGARAADRSDHPDLVETRERWRAQGFLTA